MSRPSSRRAFMKDSILAMGGFWVAGSSAADKHRKAKVYFDYSGMLIEHNLLGNVAYRAGTKLQWDAENLKATNCPEADRYIRRKYREG